MPRRSKRSITIAGIAITFVLFQLYIAGFGIMPYLVQRPIHIAFALVLTFAMITIRGKEDNDRKIPVWDWAVIILSLITLGYILINSSIIMSRPPMFRQPWDMPLAILLVLLILEAGRRRIGLTFPILTVIAIVYSVWGHLIPGLYGHSPISLRFAMEALYFSTTGIFGLLTGLSATVIAMFIIFGAFMLFTEGGQTLIDLAMALGGRMWGGGAKVAALSSAFFGMISGSAIANTAATGNFTIPLMKNIGYKP